MTTLTNISKLHGRPKLEYIQSQIKIHTKIEEYTINGIKYHNLIGMIEGKDNKTDLITAHHDVVNKKSDNILDNNASNLNLINIANNLKPKNNTIVAFTDAEETCSWNLNGVRQIFKDHAINQHLDLELTASGKNLVIDTYGDFDMLHVEKQFSMPYNNAKAGFAADFHPRGSACLTMVDDDDLKYLKNNSYCERWAQCHRLTDTLDWFCEKDTGWFVDTIIEFLK